MMIYSKVIAFIKSLLMLRHLLF